ncbi:YceG family protein [Tepidibacter formicigenes]|jgi:hypothetical protein|uniref:Putative component of 'biosynthetic module n=1 Tax=Tepidibacter formicigenes DSM 15518 TaxID=1123349 RepID=A0A1M6RD22_9FIRM|nr:YceG family protein [Tepidibacter formicigenes]SHK30352.1 Putative component of 'biosynthetic module' [Tepidibacter formicigenes DSM 15518]
MSEFQFYNLVLNSINTKTKNIYEDIFLQPKDRRGFAFNTQLIVTPIYFYRVIGISNEKEYYDTIFNLHFKLLELDSLYIKFDKSLDKNIPRELIDKVNRAWFQMEKTSLANPESIVKRVNKYNVLSNINKVKDDLIKSKLCMLLNIFMKNQKNINIIKNFYIKILYWVERYAIKPFSDYVYGETNPKVLFYGDIQRDEIYFLLFLSLIGFDVIYFNSFSGSKFKDIINIDNYSNVLEYSNRVPLKPFPFMPSIKREETVAYKASKEINQVLHTEDSGVYTPWQFEDYNLVPNSLKTTYDELLILWKEEARFRPGFKVKDRMVFMPNIFAKVNGATSDLNIYWKNLDILISKKGLTIFIENIPFTKNKYYTIRKDLLNNNGIFNLEKIISLKEYNFIYLKTSVQNLILTKLNELVASTDIFNFEITLEFKFKILYTILNLDKKYLELLQKFDYPLQIPKLVVFDGNENVFSESDFIILAFLHLIGFDIVILTPTGYNNIENGINPYYYDIHKLENLKFGLTIHNKSKKDLKKRSIFDFFK